MNGPIVPRWEWRCFGPRFEAASDLLATLTPDRRDDSRETYVLSRHGDASVKVRDGLMDVKELQTVEDDLELWRPVLKASFPLTADDIETVRVALNVQNRLPVDSATYEDFERFALEPHPDVAVVRVHKLRAHYVVDECMVELTTLDTGDARTETLVIEASDPALVRATIRRFGLEHRANVNVARGLKALTGFGAARVAVIDVGTNSVKYVMAERHDGGVHVVEDSAIVSRLGEGLDEAGVLLPEPMARTADAIAEIVQRVQTGAAADILAVGTAGLRQAPNREEFVAKVHEHAGIRVQVISGEEEARLAYVAAVSTLPRPGATSVVFDTGGGSSQFTVGRSDEIETQFSLDIGAARIADRFGLAGRVSDEQLRAASAAVAEEFGALAPYRDRDALIGMGGTATNLAAVTLGLEQYDPDRVHGTVLTVEEIDRRVEQLRVLDADGRRNVPGLQPARAEVIVAGGLILRAIATSLGHDRFTVSDRGLRHGLLAERFGG
jgi:exopolyphosphatase/guanosine-5'-triphosphate,3'-diphosphate pyrophosphatase